MIPLESINLVLFDLDGTVYCGSEMMPGANETIKFFRDNGKKVCFATNNSTKTRKQVYIKLREMGIDCSIEEVVTSGYLAALYAKKANLSGIFVFGSQNLIDELNEQGIFTTQDDSAENLLIGYNPEMSYKDLTEAVHVAMHAKCIIACNRERLFPRENAVMMPGCGAMTAPIEWCANRPCDVIIGKPSTLMVELVAELNNVDNNRSILVIGDTAESDIEMANRAGCSSILIGKADGAHVQTVSSIAEIRDVFC